MAAFAFLARRWGQNPNDLLWSLTPDQFKDYLAIEIEAQLEDRYLNAVGVLTAIASAFGRKGNNAIEKYHDLLKGEEVATSSKVETLRGKIMSNLPDGLRVVS